MFKCLIRTAFAIGRKCQSDFPGIIMRNSTADPLNIFLWLIGSKSRRIYRTELQFSLGKFLAKSTVIIIIIITNSNVKYKNEYPIYSVI